ncbi:uncharacterized protein LAESUDRAFT_717598 [Laetiporus sulphureus 93-53]|uniref:Uncharacterized protein n=1 Tax=Laetiporus sulphureus 93-53 TaxID=1314785 RepID=A0A165BM16_9APHY|nr:uncharacterized protein LAESUDRAFT_717598 [Laetiporus sulphureus 93-53]KZT01292.1 hypothetical protein LAESUDRAFT_717598 [Laetiporus sulphureus 93-53]
MATLKYLSILGEVVHFGSEYCLRGVFDVCHDALSSSSDFAIMAQLDQQSGQMTFSTRFRHEQKVENDTKMMKMSLSWSRHPDLFVHYVLALQKSLLIHPKSDRQARIPDAKFSFSWHPDTAHSPSPSTRDGAQSERHLSLIEKGDVSACLAHPKGATGDKRYSVAGDQEASIRMRARAIGGKVPGLVGDMTL